jgi:prepilin-type processing-associated H-X9-DG protein
MNNPNDKLNQAIEALQDIPTPQGPSDQLVRQTLNKIEQLQNQLPPAIAGKRRFSMKTFTKFAIAACVLFAILGGISLVDKKSGIALADVVQRVEQAKIFFYKMLVTSSGEFLPGQNAPMNIDGAVWISADLGMKMEMNINGQPGSITYLLPEQKKMVSVMPAMKQYMEIELDDDLLSKMKQQNQDPREWLKRMADSQYKSLGKSTLDGIEVEGFETTDPALAGGVTNKVLIRLWVDVQTGYPVQMEQDMDMNEGKTKMHSVIHDFQWNLEADAAIFTPQIDNDYKPLPKMQMPKMDEPSAIAGLQKYSDMTGKYPDNLNLVTLMEGLSKGAMNERNFDPTKDKTFDPNEYKGLSKEEALKKVQDGTVKKTMDIMLPIQSLGMFYMTLVQEKKDPAYYGKFVTPGDSQAILLRWKASDTIYKVIMGDLSVIEMSQEELQQIESQMPAQEQSQPESSTSMFEEAATRAGKAAARVRSATNIKKMLLACFKYAGENNGQWPATLEAIAGQDGIKTEGHIYILPNNTIPLQKNITIYESFTDWGDGINVGFADGHVKFIKDQAEFQKLLAQ